MAATDADTRAMPAGPSGQAAVAAPSVAAADRLSVVTYELAEFLMTWTVGSAGLLLRTLATLTRPATAAVWRQALSAAGLAPVDAGSDAAVESAYAATLSQAAAEDFSELAALKFVQQGGPRDGFRDRDGRPALLVLGCRFAARAVEPSLAARYVLRELEECAARAADGDYSLVYVHTGTAADDTAPSAAWLRGLWAALPARRRTGLRSLLVLHPSLQLRAGLWALGPPELGERTHYIHRLEFLWDAVVRRTCPDLPPLVSSHDAELETHPLMDYGIVAARPAAGPDAAM